MTDTPEAGPIATQGIEPADLARATKPLTPMSFHISTKDNSKFVDGRRAFFKYRDLGVTAASNGRVRAQVTTCTSAMERETGWHYHLCETQLVYHIKGWSELQFEDGTQAIVGPEEAILIPGGVRHNELRTSDDLESLEISLPADMGTVACEAPAGWQPAERSGMMKQATIDPRKEIPR